MDLQTFQWIKCCFIKAKFITDAIFELNKTIEDTNTPQGILKTRCRIHVNCSTD